MSQKQTSSPSSFDELPNINSDLKQLLSLTSLPDNTKTDFTSQVDGEAKLLREEWRQTSNDFRTRLQPFYFTSPKDAKTMVPHDRQAWIAFVRLFRLTSVMVSRQIEDQFFFLQNFSMVSLPKFPTKDDSTDKKQKAAAEMIEMELRNNQSWFQTVKSFGSTVLNTATATLKLLWNELIVPFYASIRSVFAWSEGTLRAITHWIAVHPQTTRVMLYLWNDIRRNMCDLIIREMLLPQNLKTIDVSLGRCMRLLALEAGIRLDVVEEVFPAQLGNLNPPTLTVLEAARYFGAFIRMSIEKSTNKFERYTQKVANLFIDMLPSLPGTVTRFLVELIMIQTRVGIEKTIDIWLYALAYDPKPEPLLLFHVFFPVRCIFQFVNDANVARCRAAFGLNDPRCETLLDVSRSLDAKYNETAFLEANQGSTSAVQTLQTSIRTLIAKQKQALDDIAKKEKLL